MPLVDRAKLLRSLSRVPTTGSQDSPVKTFVDQLAAELDATGGGGGTIANTTNLIAGDGAGNGVDSGIDPANVVQKNTSYPTPDTINDIVALLQAYGLCA